MSGAVKVPIKVPNDLTLAGAQFCDQFFIADPAANALGLVASDAAKVQIGNY